LGVIYDACNVSTEDSSGRGALSLLIDLHSGDMTPMEELTLASAGFKEREDLQRWGFSRVDEHAWSYSAPVNTELDLGDQIVGWAAIEQEAWLHSPGVYLPARSHPGP
jgi:hypothetical protein